MASGSGSVIRDTVRAGWELVGEGMGAISGSVGEKTVRVSESGSVKVGKGVVSGSGSFRLANPGTGDGSGVGLIVATTGDSSGVNREGEAVRVQGPISGVSGAAIRGLRGAAVGRVREATIGGVRGGSSDEERHAGTAPKPAGLAEAAEKTA